MINEDVWLSIAEYSNFKNISVSTIRRYIKSGHVESKKVDGKYFISVPADKYESVNSINIEKNDLTLKLEIQELQKRISLLEEENNDLRMLVQLYELNKQQDVELPVLPDLPVM